MLARRSQIAFGKTCYLRRGPGSRISDKNGAGKSASVCREVRGNLREEMLIRARGTLTTSNRPHGMLPRKEGILWSQGRGVVEKEDKQLREIARAMFVDSIECR